MRIFRQRARPSLLLAILIAAASVARAQEPPPAPDFNIAAQDAAGGLAQFSEQAHLQLLFDFDAVQGIRTQPVDGHLRVTDALGRLLNGTGLTFEVINERTISILRDPELLDGAMKTPLPPPKLVRREPEPP